MNDATENKNLSRCVAHQHTNLIVFLWSHHKILYADWSIAAVRSQTTYTKFERIKLRFSLVDWFEGSCCMDATRYTLRYAAYNGRTLHWRQNSNIYTSNPSELIEHSMRIIVIVGRKPLPICTCQIIFTEKTK